jgi:hypothetical protein
MVYVASTYVSSSYLFTHACVVSLSTESFMCVFAVFQLLKDRHVMVRVGGGWDTLVHYLLTHDPCKITEFKRQIAGGDNAAYLHIRGKYKT